MSLDRRRFLQVGAGAAALAVASPVFGGGSAGGSAGQSSSSRVAFPSPSSHRFRLGAVEVTVVNDGRFVLPAEIFAPEVDGPERERYFGDRHLPIDAIPLQICPVLLDTGTDRILVDTGMGPPPEAAPETGWLTRNFSVTGTTPEAIDLVVLTHCHEDHYGGLLDPATDRSRFPNADVVIARAEVDFWTDPDLSTLRPDLAESYGGLEAFEAFLTRTKGVLDSVGDRLRLIEAGEEIAPGVRGIESVGHTAGHIAVLVESEGEQLLLAGDAITNIHVAVDHPGWLSLYDDDRDQAAGTRSRLLERAASEGFLVSGYHFPFPAVGRVFRDGGAYRWLADVVG
jgi:glyoxylase-like metal-dependent hydrolase (beta-lactamase superfamily II)